MNRIVPLFLILSLLMPPLNQIAAAFYEGEISIFCEPSPFCRDKFCQLNQGHHHKTGLTRDNTYKGHICRAILKCDDKDKRGVSSAASDEKYVSDTETKLPEDHPHFQYVIDDTSVRFHSVFLPVHPKPPTSIQAS